MKAFVSIVIFGLMVGCGSLKSNTQTLTQTPGFFKSQGFVPKDNRGNTPPVFIVSLG